MSSADCAKVLHLVHDLEMGGAQKVIATLVRHHDRTKVTPIVGVLADEGPLSDEIEAAGAEIVYFHKKSAIDFGCAGRIRAHIKSNDIQLINAHNFSASLWGRMACLGLADVAFVITEHGRVGDPPLKLRLFNRLLAGKVDAIIAVSDETAEFFKKVYPYNAGKVRIVRNGITVSDEMGWSQEKLADEFGLSTDARLIVNVAAHTQVKDQDLLLRAFREVLDEMPSARLLLIGDGPLRKQLETTAEELSIADEVIFAGERTDAAKILGACDVFCLSSRNEGTSIALLEAMAAGCPVVVTDVGGNPDVVDNENVGLLVQQGDKRLLAVALLRILNNGGFATAISDAAKSKIETDYSAETQASRTEEVFTDVLRKFD